MKSTLLVLLVLTTGQALAKRQMPSPECEPTRAKVSEAVALKLGRFSVTDIRDAASERLGVRVKREDVRVELITEVAPTRAELGVINVLYSVAQGGDYFTQIAFREISFREKKNNECVWNTDVLMMKTYRLKRPVAETDFSNRRDFSLIYPRDVGLGKVRIPLE